MDTLSRRQLLERRVRQGVVGTLVVLLAALDPMVLLAQRGGVITPPIKPPHRAVPTDPALEAIVADMITTAKDARMRGATAGHIRQHAAQIRAFAKHMETHYNEQIKAWAKTQDPDVFQFQALDPKAAETLATTLRQHGLAAEGIGQAMNAPPEWKRAVMLELQTNGVSDFLNQIATRLERRVGRAGMTPALLDMMIDSTGGGGLGCFEVGLGGWVLGMIGVVLSIGTAGLALLVGAGLGIVGGLLGAYNLMGCPTSYGLPFSTTGGARWRTA
jgi:hypothetical protein